MNKKLIHDKCASLSAHLVLNDIKENKLLSVATTLFMAVSAMLLALTLLLFTNLMGAMDELMEKALTPDFLQMHTGELEEVTIAEFGNKQRGVKEYQISKFLNLENSRIDLGDFNLSDSTQDNGLCVQGERFDYLLDMENKMPHILPGEVYVPACYRMLYNVKIGDNMKIGAHQLVVAGFIRDSQMNSMMSSSKRFLVTESDYEQMREEGEEEFLIEFLLEEGVDIGTLESAYVASGLPSNGPTITKPLIRMMNALSDGMMIFVIFLISIAVVLISLLCIRFILYIRIEKDKKEVGMLKALGIGNKEIRRLYFAKYILLSAFGACLGLFMAYLLQSPLTKQMRELYGVSDHLILTGIFSCMAVILVEAIILLSIGHYLKKAEKYTVLEALFLPLESKKRSGFRQYTFIGFVVALSLFLMLLPQNLYSTLSSEHFVTYMGIGEGEIRIDVRQSDSIDKKTEDVAVKLEKDTRVKEYALLQTKSYPVYLPEGEIYNLTVEIGNHNVFPVSYVEGMAPKKEGELALSTLNAKELGVSVGDTLKLLVDEKKVTYKICGIYSDITNGGKTAKAAVISKDDVPLMWSILYVSLKESVSREEWMGEYEKMGVSVVEIATYVEGTYGQTLEQINLAKKVSVGIAVFIIYVVVALFMRLIVERNRYVISLQKALGFTSKDVKKEYLRKGMLPAVIGIVTGLLVGNMFGEGICGMILSSFGAGGFQFVVSWEHVIFTIPVIALVTATAAIVTGILIIGEITAFECCTGKE